MSALLSTYRINVFWQEWAQEIRSNVYKPLIPLLQCGSHHISRGFLTNKVDKTISYWPQMNLSSKSTKTTVEINGKCTNRGRSQANQKRDKSEIGQPITIAHTKRFWTQSKTNFTRNFSSKSLTNSEGQTSTIDHGKKSKIWKKKSKKIEKLNFYSCFCILRRKETPLKSPVEQPSHEWCDSSGWKKSNEIRKKRLNFTSVYFPQSFL